MKDIWEGIVAFFTTASADIVLRILGSAVMLFLGFKLIRIVMKLIEKSFRKSKLDQGLQGFLENAISVLLKFMLIISVLMYLGVPAASFIAILTSLGLAVGLALQGSLSNFAGGLMILFFHHFRVNDYIQANGAEGVVQNISIMYTTLKTVDGKKVVIPNALLSNGIITDSSWYDARRIDLSITADFSVEPQKVFTALEDAAGITRDILAEPAPAASLDRIQEGALVFTLRCWANTSQWWQAGLELNKNVKTQLEKAHIILRAPIMDVRQVSAAPERE